LVSGGGGGADDDVIDEVDLQDGSGGLDGPSGVVIGEARGWITTWVVVSQDKGVGVSGDGRAQDLAWMNDRLRKSAEADEVPADDGAADIEQDAYDAFLIRGEPCGGCDVLLPEGVGPVPGFPVWELGMRLERR